MILAKGLGARSGKLNDKAENRKTFTAAILSRYALVNIVMGDIADIEKKKSKGLSTLLLGAKPNQMVQVRDKYEFPDNERKGKNQRR